MELQYNGMTIYEIEAENITDEEYDSIMAIEQNVTRHKNNPHIVMIWGLFYYLINGMNDIKA